ncbi:MAG: hypothetical protein JWN49_87 [Parcubacteria group bacterium]|nr:hypothetical protein [Parcubacteria group bacterium]
MIVIKDLRVDVLGEPLFEKVNLVIQSGERVGVLCTKKSDVAIFLDAVAGTSETDEGTITYEGERIGYLSAETLQGGAETVMRVLHSRPTFLILNMTDVTDVAVTSAVKSLLAGFRGGVLMGAEDPQLMEMAKVKRVLEIHISTKLITSFAGSYTDYLIEREKNQARFNDAYEKQQKEKRRLEDWLAQKRVEAAKDKRSAQKGATIRTKAKYLQREILDKEIPKPLELE